MLKKVVLSQEEKDKMGDYIDNLNIARTAFKHASQLIHDAEKKMWVALKEINPTAIRIAHPDDGEWYYEIED